VANLTAILPAGIDPITIGSVTLSEAHGLSFPEPNGMTAKGDLRAAFSGLDQAFLIGVSPDPSLSDHAALTDQSDAWTHLALDGGDVEDVLARLPPVDVLITAFPVGDAKRSSLGHMSALFLRTSETCFEVLVFRSMARTALHDLTRAMRGVAARQNA